MVLLARTKDIFVEFDNALMDNESTVREYLEQKGKSIESITDVLDVWNFPINSKATPDAIGAKLKALNEAAGVYLRENADNYILREYMENKFPRKNGGPELGM